MQKLVWQNAKGEETDLTSGNFGITEWEGFSNTGLNIQTQTVPFQDGSVYLDSLIEQRELSVTLAMQDNNNLELRYQNRRILISALNPKLGEGYLIYTNDFISKRIKCIPQIPLFENHNSDTAGTPKASLSWTACSPYWEDLEETTIKVLSGTNTIQNDGDVYTPVKIKILSYTLNPVIVNQSVGKLISITGQENDNGDILINTGNGEKSVKSQKLYFSWSLGGSITDFLITPSKTFYVGTNIIIEDNLKGDLTSLHANTTVRFYSIIYAKGLYVATASSIYTSIDGINWEERATSRISNPYRDVMYCEEKDLFVAVGFGYYGPNSYGIIATSTDGITWTNITNGTQILRAVTYGNGLFVVAGEGGTILTSPDGITWTKQTNEIYNHLYDVEYLNGIFIIVGTGGLILTSTDGLTWTTQTSGASSTWLYSVCYGNNLFVIVGGRTILTSTDGITWNQRSQEIGLSKIKFQNGVFTATGDGGAIMTSLDGVNWVQKYQHKYFPCDANYLIYCEQKDLFVMLNNYDIYTSTDGIVWTERMSGTETLRNIVYSAEKELFVVVGDRGVIFTSTDGLTWTTQTSGVTNRLVTVSYGNGIFVTSEITTNKIYISSDGITWTEGATFSNLVISITFGNGLFVAVKNGRGGTGSAILTSVDGINWTQQSLEPIGLLRSVCYGNGMFVAGSDNGHDGAIYTSIDGITWFRQENNNNFNSFQITNMLYANGLFFAIASSKIQISNDGKNWEVVNQSGSSAINGVAYKNGVFTAVGTCVLNTLFPIEENIISSLDFDSDMTFGLGVGDNRVIFTNDEGKHCIMTYRQKYIGV